MTVIKNNCELGTTTLRKDALSIAESAYEAIDTGAVVRRSLSFSGTQLYVGGRSYDLTKFKRVRIIGFGKASCRAIQEIENILRGHLNGGLALDVRPGTCEVVELVEGTHPKPSAANVEMSERIVEMAREGAEDDLFIAVVSGGGSALLCWPKEECDQGARLYDDFLRTGATIEEMNIVRKHLSHVKGGGLAQLFYPASVIALIFCDVPGGHYDEVASGPTFYDATTIVDAQAVLDRYSLSGYSLNETPKDHKYFERVQNIQAVSNTTAVEAMTKHARSLGYDVVSIGDALYEDVAGLVKHMFDHARPKTAVIAAGEPRLVVTQKGGSGGRCGQSALEALKRLEKSDVFLACASDGRDNSDAAGAIADAAVSDSAAALGLSIDDHLLRFDGYNFFNACGALLMTGPTEANISDFFIMLRS